MSANHRGRVRRLERAWGTEGDPCPSCGRTPDTIDFVEVCRHGQAPVGSQPDTRPLCRTCGLPIGVLFIETAAGGD